MTEMGKAVSDVFVVGTALYGVQQLYKFNLVSAFGFLLIGAAAFAGVLRFGIWPDEIVGIHKFLSAYAATVGVPLLCLGFSIMDPEHLHTSQYGFLVSSLIIFSGLFFIFRYVVEWPLYGIVVSALTLMPVILAGFRDGNIHCFLAVVEYLIAGLFFRDNIEVFHYLLSAGNVSFVLALVRLRTNISIARNSVV